MRCPVCNRTHDDKPTPKRVRICEACWDAALKRGAGPQPPAKKRRSKQTPAPLLDLPPKTE